MPDLDVILREKCWHFAPGLFRRFACESCQRISHLFTDPICSSLLEFARGRVINPPSQHQLTSLRSESTQLYDQLYPGYGYPSAAALALAAVGEAAFTESDLEAAIGAASTAAQAKAASAAATVDDAQYNEVYQTSYLAERQAQLELLRALESIFPVI